MIYVHYGTYPMWPISNLPISYDPAPPNYETHFILSKFCYRSFANANGPCSLMVIITLLISNIILILKKPKSPYKNESPDHKRNLFLILTFFITCLSITFVVVYFISAEEYGLFIFVALIVAQVQHCVLISYIVKTPKLKSFVFLTYQNSKTKIVCDEIYFILETIYDCFVFIICLGQTIQHFKHKSSKQSSQIHPIV